MNPSRRRFLASALLTSAAGLAGHRLVAADNPPARPAERERPPPLDRELVWTMVRVAHFDLEQVKKLLAQEPNLVNAAWDWGAGDWEVPLEAAAHIGRREIARHLLAHGARPSLFASAMLGDRPTVAAAVNAFPAIANTRGPHGFTLLYHAAISGDVAMAEAIQPHLAMPDHDFNQALQAAVRDNHPAMTTWLLEHGVTDPNTRDFTGKTPLALAVSKGYSEVAAILRSHDATE